MATDVEIASLALTRIGHEGVSSFSASGNKASRWFNSNFETIKKALLREHPWNFAIKRVALVATTAPVNEYSNAYTLPADFLRVVRINGDAKAGYRVERGTLATYEATATLEYVYDVTDESAFSADFTDLLAQRLAAEISLYMTDSSGTAEMSWKLYEQKLARARANDSREATPRYRTANLAIALLGEVAGRQGDDAAASRESSARVIEAMWSTIRKSMLREHAWNFAVKRAILTKATIRTITGATAANPVVITSAAHGFANGDTVYIDSIIGMSEINGRTFTVANQATNTFQLSGEDGTDHTAYASGGSAYPYIAKEFRYRFTLPADCLRLLRINRTEADEYRVEQGYIYTDESEVDIEYVMDVTDEDDFDVSFFDVFSARLAAEAAISVNPAATQGLWSIYQQKLRMARGMNAREGTPRDVEADLWLGARA